MIDSEHLVLRKLKFSDIDDLVEQGNDYDVHYYGFFLMKYPFTKEEAVLVVKEEDHVKNLKRFGIELKDAPVLHSCQNQESSPARGKIIGVTDLYNINLKSRKLKVGYWIGKNYRRKGYANEAVKKVIKYAFANYDIDEIIATTLTDNDPSMNLLVKNGFVRGKILKNDRFFEGKYMDSVQFVLKRK